MARVLIRHAECVLPGETVRTNVLIDGDRIASVGAPDSTAADEVVDAGGLHLIPGVIDDQVHFREPGLTHKEDLHTGTLAAAKGGVTTVLEMPNTSPTTTTRERLLEKLELASRRCVVNYGFYIGATAENVAELQPTDRTPGIKIFIGSSTGDLLVDEQGALERIFAETTLPICAHCEDESIIRSNTQALGGGREFADHSRIRTREAAAVSAARTIELAHRHGHRFHLLHSSTAEEVELVADHRNLVTAEVCLHHLWFTVDDYPRLGSLVQMNPSVKHASDHEALWAGLLDGRIQVIATDHAPHTLEEKDRSYPDSPSGVPAVENSLALMLDAVNRGRCTLRQVVGWMCDAPARVWDIVGKGRIAEGWDADLVLVDLGRRHEIRNEAQVTRSGWSPWHGVSLTGLPVRTFVMGETVFDLARGDAALDDAVRGREVVFDHARGGYWGTASS